MICTLSPRICLASIATAFCVSLSAGCAEPDKYPEPTEPGSASVTSVDRFGDFGVLFNRDSPAFNPGVTQGNIPEANEPFDMDEMFLVNALGPDGELVTYYGLDMAGVAPANAYVVVDENMSEFDGQLPIIETLPGDDGYNDFVLISLVAVGDDYQANSFTAKADIVAAVDQGVAVIVPTTRVENWAPVPNGTTASRKFDGVPVSGWTAWKDSTVTHFLKFDADLELTEGEAVPQSTVIVIFADGMSPAEGFLAEPPDMIQTHNVLETLPGDADYSSLWVHRMGDPNGFAMVEDWSSADANTIMLLPNVLVNCPIVAP
jgi:hypothetical protein